MPCSLNKRKTSEDILICVNRVSHQRFTLHLYFDILHPQVNIDCDHRWQSVVTMSRCHSESDSHSDKDSYHDNDYDADRTTTTLLSDQDNSHNTSTLQGTSVLT